MASGDEVVSETPRLRLRRLRLGDIDEVAAMVGDPEQMRFYPRPKSRDEVRVWLAWNLALYEENGFVHVRGRPWRTRWCRNRHWR